MHIILLILTVAEYFVMYIHTLFPFHSFWWGSRLLPPPHNHRVDSMSLGTCTPVSLGTMPGLELLGLRLSVHLFCGSCIRWLYSQTWSSFPIFASLSGIRYLISNLYFSDYLWTSSSLHLLFIFLGVSSFIVFAHLMLGFSSSYVDLRSILIFWMLVPYQSIAKI